MRTIKLRDIASPISINISNPSDCGYDKFVGLEHYDSGEFVISRYSGVKLLTSAAKEFKKNDILIARRNVYLKRAGIVKFDGITSGDSIILRVNEHTVDTVGVPREIIEDYLPLVLNTEDFWLYANKHADGMNSKRISKDTLLDYEFMLPSEIEIKTISEKAWAAYRLKEAYKRLLVATDEMVKSQFIEMFGNPVSNDRNWDYECINSVAPESPAAHDEDDQVWLLNLDMIESNTGNIIKKIVVPKSEVLSAQPFDKGNVLFSKLRPYLNKVVSPKDKGYATTELVPLRPNQNILNRVFFTYLLRSDQFVQFANDISGGTKMPRMPLKELREFKCILPPINLQERFAEIVRQADKSKFELKKAIEAIDQVIKSLING